MSRPDAGESVPSQPDGGLLSIVGDLLFAGAILVMIFPCLRRTADRIDRQFFKQLVYIVEVLMAVAALCFVLMLLVAQQMRVTYCSFIRPYIGDSPEDKVYAGILLKILVCALLIFNYTCASGLQRLVGSYFERFQTVHLHQAMGPRVISQCLQSFVTTREVLSNNSNTNSQTPATQTQTMTHSDILASVSCPVLISDSFLDQAPKTQHPHQRLYRDVGTMVRFPDYPSSLCTVQFCRNQVISSSAESVLHSPPAPGCSRHSPLHRPSSGSSGFCADLGYIPHLQCPADIPRVQCPADIPRVQCPADIPRVHCPADIPRVQCPADMPRVQFHPGVHSEGCQAGPASQSRDRTVTSPQACVTAASVTTHSSQAHHHLFSSGQSQAGTSSKVQTAVLGGPHISSTQGPCYLLDAMSVSQPGRPGLAVDSACSCHSEATSGHVTSETSCTTFRVPSRPSGTVQSRRRRKPLPTMPKMTRSGKIYGYG